MSRRIKSLHFNLQEGENVIFHREHRSKRGRARKNRNNNERFLKYKREKEELRWGVDKKSLRYMKNRYNI